MSAKKAKQLRKLTKSIVTMQIASGNKISDETLYVEKQKNRKYGIVPDKMGGEGQRVQIAAGTILTTTSSVRGVYKAIKKKLAKDGTLETKPYTGKTKRQKMLDEARAAIAQTGASKPGAPSARGQLIDEAASEEPTTA